MLFSASSIEAVCPGEVPVGAPLWPFKQDLDALAVLERGDRYTYASQYQQNPSPVGGGMFKDEYWKYYDLLPPDIDTLRIYGDTAQKTGEQNHYTVFQLWARSPDMGIFLVDSCRGKWEAPELESQLVAFWNKHKPTQFKTQGAQVVRIEDKSSGSSLIQSIQRNYFIPIEPIQRNTDKFTRAMGAVRYIAAGHVHLPRSEPWVYDYTDEFSKFTPLMTHAYDDQIDPTLDAIDDLLVFDDQLYTERAI